MEGEAGKGVEGVESGIGEFHHKEGDNANFRSTHQTQEFTRLALTLRTQDAFIHSAA
jgi:hypothetical protein